MQCSDGSTPEVCTGQRTSIAVHLARNRITQLDDDNDDDVMSLMTAHVTSDPCDRCAEVVKSEQGLVLDLSDYNMEVRECASDVSSDASGDGDDVCVSLMGTRQRGGNKCGDDVTLYDPSILCASTEGEKAKSSSKHQRFSTNSTVECCRCAGGATTVSA